MLRRISLQYFEGCPNWRITAEHLTRLVDEGLKMTIALELIDSHETAVARGFRGSPTVLVDGADPFADDSAPIGLACRMYSNESGIAGSPSLAQLRNAIAPRREG